MASSAHDQKYRTSIDVYVQELYSRERGPYPNSAAFGVEHISCDLCGTENVAMYFSNEADPAVVVFFDAEHDEMVANSLSSDYSEDGRLSGDTGAICEPCLRRVDEWTPNLTQLQCVDCDLSSPSHGLYWLDGQDYPFCEYHMAQHLFYGEGMADYAGGVLKQLMTNEGVADL